MIDLTKEYNSVFDIIPCDEKGEFGSLRVECDNNFVDIYVKNQHDVQVFDCHYALLPNRQVRILSLTELGNQFALQLEAMVVVNEYDLYNFIMSIAGKVL